MSLYPFEEFKAEEILVLARFGKGEPAPESYLPPACPVYSHGADGWHCSETGEHDVHRSATGEVTWGAEPHGDGADCFCSPRQVGTLGVWTHNMGEEG